MITDYQFIYNLIYFSPILSLAEYKYVEYIDGSDVPVCLTQATSSWSIGYFLMTISIFFIIPLFILILLYGIIAKNLVSKTGAMMKVRPNKPELSLKARRQVVLMLGAVVLSFFICLLPFRAFTLWIIFSSQSSVLSLGIEKYYGILYFSRIMVYLNSAVNPILYNLMSSKFRKGFFKILKMFYLNICCKRMSDSGRLQIQSRNTNTTTSSSYLSARHSNRRGSDDLKYKIDIQTPAVKVYLLKGKSADIFPDDSINESSIKVSNRNCKKQISFDEIILNNNKQRTDELLIKKH